MDRSKSVDLADIVYQSEQPPLYIHFQLGTQSEAVHALVHTDVGEDRLDRGRLDKSQATVATAHLIARVVYKMLKYKVEYDKINVEEYEEKYKQAQIKYMKKKAEKFGFQLVPA